MGAHSASTVVSAVSVKQGTHILPVSDMISCLDSIRQTNTNGIAAYDTRAYRRRHTVK